MWTVTIMELNESKIREGLRNALPHCDPVIENSVVNLIIDAHNYPPDPTLAWPVTDEMRQVLCDWSNGKSFSTSKVCARIARLGFHALVDELPRVPYITDRHVVSVGGYLIRRSALHALDPEWKP